MTGKTEDAELRRIAVETYERLRIGRPELPGADSEYGRRQIDRLCGIIKKYALNETHVRHLEPTLREVEL